MTPLEEAQAKSQELFDQLNWQTDKLRGIGKWSDGHAIALNLEIAKLRLEQLIEFMFEPQLEVSRIHFELLWEERQAEYLKTSLEGARHILFMPTED